ncbi:hypothetical protein AVEN_248868-1 [Araneus ventricosus]|uniref:Uncharacterized protein n=1 Tax=Araneus ventricosus TaxID=182803 RepID=A0A4Y2SCD4_ARAVE|nr:hypothetical protein AVEN_248868-1 [Araneus ventricosus]
MGGRLATTYDLTCNRPHTQQVYNGIGFGFEPGIPWPQSRDLTTRPPRPDSMGRGIKRWWFGVPMTMIGEDMQKCSRSRAMRVVAVGCISIRNLPENNEQNTTHF